VAAKGDFMVYRPTLSDFGHNPYGLPVGLSLSGSAFYTLAGHMEWKTKVNSIFDGVTGVTQLLNASGAVSCWKYTFGSFYLDGNTEIYALDQQNYPSTGKPYVIGDAGFDPFIGQVDDPSTFPPLPGPTMVGSYKDYVRFKPGTTSDELNNNIWVTLGIVYWHINGSALVPYGLVNQDMPFASQPDSSDEFPEWTDNVPE
jgi:hypothetical protein